jgi:predicted nucleic acid-binding protein
VSVLVDTCIWSYALRSKHQGFEAYVQQLNHLINENRVFIIGAIKQELLSGYSDSIKFESLNQHLSYFQNEQILDVDYIEAARFSNRCRQKGIQGSHTDFLICAVAVRLDVEILTTDKDFTFYQQHLPIKLYSLQNH